MPEPPYTPPGPSGPPVPAAPAPPALPPAPSSIHLVPARTSGVAIFGGVVATAGCAVLTFLQVASAVLGLAFDSPLRDQTPREIRNGEIWVVLWSMSSLAAALTLAALTLTIMAAANRERRIIVWVLLPLLINLVLCVLTWGFGLASIPDSASVGSMTTF